MSEENKLAQLRSVPRFRNNERTLNRLSWGLSLVIAVAFIGFNLAVVYAGDWLALPLTDETVISRGIVIGVGIIVFAFLLTAYYIRAIGRRMDILHDEFTGDRS
jgi:uncharacterized membrane protein (DUF485 family)